MPEPFQYMIALAAAFAVSFLAIFISHLTMRATIPSLARFVSMVGLVLGLLTGYRILGFESRWPPVNALDRFLMIVLPAAMIVEFIRAVQVPDDQHNFLSRFAGFCAATVRFTFIVSVGRILWHDSVYLSSVESNTSDWPPFVAFGVLLSGAALLYVALRSSMVLAFRGVSASLTAGLVMSLLATGMVTMLAGYIKGGAAAMPLVGGICGAALALWIKEKKTGPVKSNGQFLIGISVTALFSLLWIGRFFGQLTTFDVLMIFLSPHCCWLSEFWPCRDYDNNHRMAIRMAAVALILLVVLFFKWQQFMQKMVPLIAFQTE
jgi:hypothetical protein